jgi:hypothetical protein
MAYNPISGPIGRLFPHPDRGWVKGDEPPLDRLETWDYDMHQASGWSKEIVNFDRVWINETVSEAERDAAWKKFGQPLSSDRTRDVSLKR